MKYVFGVVVFFVFLQSRLATAMTADFDPHKIPTITLGSYPPSLKPGNGIIEGYLKAKTKSFGELTYANQEVLLLPNSSFSRWYINDVAYMIENPNAKDALSNYPNDLVKYTRSVRSDTNGFFRFNGLPDGKYYVWTYLEHEVDSHPTRERTQLAMGANGEMVSVPTFRKGLRIRSDDVVIAGDANVDTADGYPGVRIDSFVVVGEYTCCSAEI